MYLSFFDLLELGKDDCSSFTLLLEYLEILGGRDSRSNGVSYFLLLSGG